MTDSIRWRAIREANTVPGSSDPTVWAAAYRAACIALMCEAVGRPLAPWQWDFLRASLGAPRETVRLRSWRGRTLRVVSA